MMLLSIFPGWESVHPIMIHFPIALLLVAPLFILIAAVLSPPKGRPFMISALILLGLGTASLFVAISAGEAAAKVLPNYGTTGQLIATHQNLAFETRGIFVMLLVLYVAIMLVPKVLHRDGRLFSTVLPIAFLLLYCAGAVVLVNTAHDGGRLVHEFGVHAIEPSSGQSPQLARHSAN
jgi:uncharacterized membrane protein